MHAATWTDLRNIVLTGSRLPGRPTRLSHPSQTYLCGRVRTHACTRVVWASDMASAHFLPQILCACPSSAWTALPPDSELSPALASSRSLLTCSSGERPSLSRPVQDVKQHLPLRFWPSSLIYNVFVGAFVEYLPPPVRT